LTPFKVIPDSIGLLIFCIDLSSLKGLTELKPMNQQKTLTIFAASYALTAVLLGAFGAHALNAGLESRGTVTTWQTAVDYQMWHALAIWLLASSGLRGKAAGWAGLGFCLGIPLFSGSLYWLALDGPRWLGPVTPLGGLLFMAAWIMLIVAVVQSKKSV
jgi:uncharacterized membrane protein YgdD (TMEM256/DUF423 family)